MDRLTRSFEPNGLRARLLAAFLLAIVLAAVSACRQFHQPPFDRAFDLTGTTPRILFASTETTVPLTIANTGERAWDPARVHLSYHWLWLVPRELARRSRWDVPYHEGIRTDLERPVAPGERVSLRGRILPPRIPGLYWLQWDMVDEGAAWFSQVSPRQSRALVIVAPTAAGLFAPLPLVIALGGLLAIAALNTRASPSADVRAWQRSGIAFVAIADVIWCAATLLAKQILIVPATLLEPTAVAYWLMAAAALAPPVVALALLPRRVRAWLLLTIGTLGSLFLLADVIYYRFFGDLISTPALLAARQTGRVAASIRSFFTGDLVWFVIDLPFAAWLVIRLGRVKSVGWLPRRAVAALVLLATAAIGLAIGAPQTLQSLDLSQVFRDRAVAEQLGLFGYHAYDAWAYAAATMFRPAPTAAELDEVRAWFAERRGLRAGAGPSFGAARGRNVIVVQVESLQDFVVDYRFGDQEVMPSLRTWERDSLRFTNVTDQTNEGRTSDAELTTLASLLPLDHGAAAFRYPGNHFVGLPAVLAEHGYRTLSAVAFEPGFWNRQVMHPAYGFERTLFEPDFTLTEQIGWGLNDRDFLQQMVPRLEQLPKPFCAWLITLSLHHPFDEFPDRHKVLKLGSLEGTGFGNYLHTMRFFDEALAAFMAALARDHLLDDSVVVVFGDHDAGFARDPAEDEGAWALKDRVPLFVRVPGAPSDALRGARDIAAGQTDLAPTLLGLVGIDAAPLPFVGRNLLGQADNPPVLRPFGEWMDARHLFASASGDPQRECYDIRQRTFTAPAACAAAADRARRDRAIARLVLSEDLQRRLR